MIISLSNLEFIRSDYVFLIMLILVAYATIKDIRYREIPDWISVVLFILGISIAGLYCVGNVLSEGLKITSFLPLVSLLIGFIVYLIIGIVLLYTGQWGGGDLKLFAATGSLIGFNLANIISSLLLEYLLFLSISAALYGIFVISTTALKNWSSFKQGFKQVFVRYKAIITLALVLAVLVTLLWVVSSSPLGVYFGNLGMVGSISSLWSLPIVILFLALSVLLVIVSKAVEQYCLVAKIPVDKLTVGDWLAEDVVFKGRVIVKQTKPGLSDKDINRLKRFGVKKVLVKQGLPFIPSMLIALIALFIALKLGFNLTAWLSILF